MNHMRLGVTGTQQGLTEKQISSAAQIITEIMENNLVVSELHHGDCIGADYQFAHIVFLLLPDTKIIAHPCNINNKRAHFEHNTEVRETLPPLVRNKNIVANANILIAFPKEQKEVLRSGTWATVRAARKQNLPRIIIYPSGKITRTFVNW